MSSAARRRLLLGGLILLLTIPLAFLLSHAAGGIVRDLLVWPFLYLAWVARLYLRTVPQALFWGGLLFFGVVLLVIDVLFARHRAGRGDMERPTSAKEVPADNGPVSRLAGQIQNAARSAYFRGTLARDLGKLALQIEGDGEGAGGESIQRGLDDLDAPPEVMAFLMEGERPISLHWRGGVIALFRRRLLRLAGDDAAPGDLPRTVRYLEDRLEDL